MILVLLYLQSSVPVPPAPAGATPGRSPVVPLTPPSQANTTAPAPASAISPQPGECLHNINYYVGYMQIHVDYMQLCKR